MEILINGRDKMKFNEIIGTHYQYKSRIFIDRLHFNFNFDTEPVSCSRAVWIAALHGSKTFEIVFTFVLLISFSCGIYIQTVEWTAITMSIILLAFMGRQSTVQRRICWGPASPPQKCIWEQYRNQCSIIFSAFSIGFGWLVHPPRSRRTDFITPRTYMQEIF